MSRLNDGLMLHLALDEIQDGLLLDSSDFDNDGTIIGNPQLVADDTFGSCMSFDGVKDCVDLPVASIPQGKEITIAFWANGASSVPKMSSIIGANDTTNDKNRVLNIHLPWSDQKVVFDCGFGEAEGSNTYDRIQQLIKPTDIDGKWTHWVFMKDVASCEMKIFMNGVPWLNGASKRRPMKEAGSFKLAAYPGIGFYYHGRLAHFRIYSRTLSEKEIKQLMYEDQTAAAAFRKTHPLGFNLFDKDDQQVIYIGDNPADSQLSLEIHNTSHQIILLTPPDSGVAAASADYHHFELKFRPGTLLTPKPNQLEISKIKLNGESLDKNKFLISYAKQRDGGASLYFLKTAETLSFEPDARLVLTLQSIEADRRGGSRGTRVELKYRGLTYAGDRTPINGKGVQHISIVNHRGRKNLPLHVGIVGSNTILNDGASDNGVILCIANADQDNPITLSKTEDAPSKFIISFDVQSKTENKEWALMNINEGVKDIRVQVKQPDKGDWGEPLPSVDRGEEKSPEWSIETKDLSELQPGQHVQVKISGIKSSMPSGQTNVYVRYENIPGYWDGQFITTLQKTPLIESNLVKGNIGIGTAEPRQKLEIKGNIQLSGVRTKLFYRGDSDDHIGSLSFSTIDKGGTAIITPCDDTGANLSNSTIVLGGFKDFKENKVNLSVSGRVGIGTNQPRAILEVGDTSDFPMKSILACLSEGNGEGGTYLGVKAYNTQVGSVKSFALEHYFYGKPNSAINFYRGGSETGGKIAFSTNDGTEKMVINGNGRVGIGIDEPEVKLHVAGDVLCTKLHVKEESLFDGNLTVQGSFDIADTAKNKMKSILARLDEGNKQGGTYLGVKAYDTQVGSLKSFALEHYFYGCLNSSIDFYRGGGVQGGGIGFSTSNGTGKMFIDSEGRVGVGTSTPNTARLVVHGTGNSFHIDKYHYLNRNGVGEVNNENARYSIHADGRVAAIEFNAFSDERIKNIEGRSDGATDLQTLLGIEVADYRYKDVIGKGDALHKKLIAQQVEKVFPQAVSKHTNIIPDIYQQAPFAGGWLELATNLKKGERVRLLSDKTEGVYEVLEVTKDKFRTDFQPEADKVFVFGREVNDFRNLDYDAIAALNVSATQQLKKEKDEEIKALRAEITELKAAHYALLKKLESTESKIEAAEKTA
jgi:hypothetical protein